MLERLNLETINEEDSYATKSVNDSEKVSKASHKISRELIEILS